MDKTPDSDDLQRWERAKKRAEEKKKQKSTQNHSNANDDIRNETNNKKPLSERPLGYALAVAGGILGSGLGLFVSPLVLRVLNSLQPTKDGITPNRFKTWALVGIIGAPLCAGITLSIIGESNTSSNRSNTLSKSIDSPQEAIKEYEFRSRWRCEDALKSQLKDPSSYKPNNVLHLTPEQIKTLNSSVGDTLYERSGYFDVWIDYTARNGFGGATRGGFQCAFSKNGNLLNYYSYD